MSEPYALHAFLDGLLFTTEAGVEYFLLVKSEGREQLSDVADLADHLFSIAFFPLNEAQFVKLPPDPRVIVTILSVIHNILREDLSVVFFVVDEADGRYPARSRLFGRMLKQKADGLSVLTDYVPTRGDFLLAALICHASNPYRAALQERFAAFVEGRRK